MLRLSGACGAGGLPDVVRHEFNGLLVAEKEAEGLAMALRRLIREPDTRARRVAISATGATG